jgi:hypothetical protein
MNWEKLLNLPNLEDKVVSGADRDMQEFVIKRLLSIEGFLSIARSVGFTVTATVKGRTALLLSDNPNADRLLATLCFVETDPWEVDRVRKDALVVVERFRNRAILAFVGSTAFAVIFLLGCIIALFSHPSDFGFPAASRFVMVLMFGIISWGAYPAAFERLPAEIELAKTDVVR